MQYGILCTYTIHGGLWTGVAETSVGGFQFPSRNLLTQLMGYMPPRVVTYFSVGPFAVPAG